MYTSLVAGVMVVNEIDFFVLLFETQSAVFLFCLPFCVCLHALGEAVTSPFLEGVSLRRSVFRQTVCVHWL